MHRILLLLACLLGCGYSGLGEPPPDNRREELSVTPTVDEARCEALGPDLVPPEALLETEGVGCDPREEPYCFRLAPELSAVASEADPVAALAASARAFAAFDATRDPADEARARALADLAVTGARAYARFAADPPDADALADRAPPDADALADRAPPDAVDRALRRAYRVAWALHGPPSHRRAERRDLGWIAVSPQDDLPPRPVNVAATSAHQRDLEVEVPLEDGSVRRLRARIAIHTNALASSPAAPDDLVGAVPDESAVVPPATGDVVIFIHGHSSSAEESEGLAEELLRRYEERGEELTLLAFDLPGSGYTERVDPEGLLARADAARSQDVLLRFLDEFVEALVRALEAETPGVTDRIAAVIGGSLGGNMVLRLAEQAETRPWVRRGVAWSPVSIDYSWTRAKLLGGDDESFMDVIKHEAVRRTHHESIEAEDRGARVRYFVDGVMSVRKQSDYWYREGWEPCGPRLVEEGLRKLGEVYDSRLRRFHYRLAYEQLVFSHIEPDETGQLRFRRIEVPMTLIAGERDDEVPMTTRYFVDRLAPHLTMPGRTLVFEDTGHALHAERPAMLADAVDAALHE